MKHFVKTLRSYYSKAHPGIGIALEYMESPSTRRDHLRILHDALEESGHTGLQRYLNLSGLGGRARHALVRDIADRLSGNRGSLIWRNETNHTGRWTRYAVVGHGLYEISPGGLNYATRNYGNEDRPWGRPRRIAGGGDATATEELEHTALEHHQRTLDRIENPEAE